MGAGQLTICSSAIGGKAASCAARLQHVPRTGNQRRQFALLVSAKAGISCSSGAESGFEPPASFSAPQPLGSEHT